MELELGNVLIEKVHIDDNLVDSFMKTLSQSKFKSHAKGIALRLASGWI